MTFTVANTSANIPVILGKTWINRYYVGLIYNEVASLRVKVDGKLFTVYNPADLRLKEGGNNGLSTLQGNKLPRVSC